MILVESKKRKASFLKVSFVILNLIIQKNYLLPILIKSNQSEWNDDDQQE